MLNTDCFKVLVDLLNKYKLCFHQFPHLNLSVFTFKIGFLILPHQYWTLIASEEVFAMEMNGDKVHFLHRVSSCFDSSVSLTPDFAATVAEKHFSSPTHALKSVERYKQKFGQNSLYSARKCLISLKLKDLLRKKEVENIMSRYFCTKAGTVYPLHC